MKIKLILALVLLSTMTLTGCTGKSSGTSGGQEINPADTIYLGDLREKFEGDSLFFKVVAPELMLDDYQYFWPATSSSAIEKGLTKEYYKKVQKEITATNEAIRRGVMKGADVKRIPDFQKK